MTRTYLLALAALALLGCERRWTSPVAEVSCGTLQLRVEERGHYLAGGTTTTYTPTLSMNDGSGWKVVDDVGWNVGPEAYARLMPANARFHVFRRSDDRWKDDYTVNKWVLYIDPMKITGAEYDAVCHCLDAKLAAIDAAWGTPRRSGDGPPAARRFRLSSMVHAPWDQRYYAAEATLGTRWECADGSFVKTEPPDIIDHCVARKCRTVGRIEEEGTAVRLYDPLSAADLGQCRDAAGRRFTDALRPI